MMDIKRIDHPLSSTRVLEGEVVSIDDWHVRVHAVSDRNRDFLALVAASPEDPAQRRAYMLEVLPAFLAENVVITWRGLSSGGEDVAHTPEVARSLFETHPAMAQAVLDAAMRAGDAADKRNAESDDRLGNLPPGGTSGVPTPATLRSSNAAPPPATTSPPSNAVRALDPPSDLRGSAGAT